MKAELCYVVGLMHYEGLRGKNYEESFRLFSDALKKGIWKASFYLAEQFFNGQGVETDQEKAFQHYFIGANSGDGECMNKVGECYEFGEGTEFDTARSIEYYEKGSVKGDMMAYANLGYILLHGRAVPANPTRGIRLLLESSNAGVMQPAKDLAECYQFGLGEEKRNPRKSFELMKSAYYNGVRFSGYMFAVYYEKGLGVEKDFTMAAKLYRKSYERGGREGRIAKAYWGYCLVTGNIPFHYFGLATRAGHEKAHLKMEKYLVEGSGIEHPRILGDEIEEEDKIRKQWKDKRF